MCEAVHIPRAKDKTPAKLKRIFPQFALTVAGGAGTFAALEIILAQNVQQIGDPEVSYPVCLPLLVNQQRKIDPGFLLKNARVVQVSETDRSKGHTPIQEFCFVRAQLRDVFPAEYSPIVPQKDDYCGIIRPQGAHSNFFARYIGKSNVGKPLAKWFHRLGLSFESALVMSRPARLAGLGRVACLKSL